MKGNFILYNYLTLFQEKPVSFHRFISLYCKTNPEICLHSSATDKNNVLIFRDFITYHKFLIVFENKKFLLNSKFYVLLFEVLFIITELPEILTELPEILTELPEILTGCPA